MDYHIDDMDICQRVQQPYPAGKDQQYTLHNFGPHKVSLHQGPPAAPAWYFRFADRNTLDNFHQKIWTATTAAAQSTSADEVALKSLPMDGFTET